MFIIDRQARFRHAGKICVLIASTLFLAGIASAARADAQEPLAWSDPSAASISGRYEYKDAELVGYLELRADQTFEYKVVGTGQPVEGEEPLQLFFHGVWRFEDRGRIVLTNSPTTPPVFRQISADRDPTVRASFTITSTDGRPVEELGLLTDSGDDGGLHVLSSGRWIIPLYHEWDTDDGKKGSPTRLPGTWEIMRSSDALSLVKIALSPTGPNRFTFSYTPSPIEPFELAAAPVSGEPGMIEVAFGTASIKMRRVSAK